MTLQELNAIYQLHSELDKLTEMRESLIEAATKITSKPSGMPHGNGITDKVGMFAPEIADIDQEIKRTNEKIAEKENSIAAWIETIPDNQLRLLCRLRFLRGMQWKEVASAFGKYYTEEAAKMSVYRYLQSQKKGKKGK